MKICFIGFGNMAKAIAKSLVTQKGLEIHACSPSLPEGQNQQGIYTHYDNNTGAHEAEIIILAVKPPQILPVIKELRYAPGTVVISVAAAVELRAIRDALPDGIAAVRAMPNTPIEVGFGATPMVASPDCQPEHLKAAERIFGAGGITEWVEEAELEALGPLSGSGPAYVFLFLEALIEAGVELGLSEAVSQRFSLQTLAGALQLCQNSTDSIVSLRQNVTSPGGTTAEALRVFADAKFKPMVENALKAAQNRAQQIREELV